MQWRSPALWLLKHRRACLIVLGLVMPIERYHIHSLGLVAAAARAVENQHQSDLLMAEQNVQLAQLNTILSAISDGILVLNTSHMLVHANHAASQMLGIPAQSMMGKPAGMLLSVPAFVEDAIQERKSLTDVEGVIHISDRTVNCLISLDFVFQNPDKLQWIIVTLRSEKKVRKLIQQQVGATAPLTLDDIPGEAPQMQRVRSFVRSAAGAQASILIRGEVGTGKNALASAIHNAGPRHDGPFVIFASASVPTELVISDLLGYDESVENKRVSGRPSKFELAQGGTLFFQDVDALPLEAQVLHGHDRRADPPHDRGRERQVARYAGTALDGRAADAGARRVQPDVRHGGRADDGGLGGGLGAVRARVLRRPEALPARRAGRGIEGLSRRSDRASARTHALRVSPSRCVAITRNSA